MEDKVRRKMLLFMLKAIKLLTSINIQPPFIQVLPMLT